ncbi:MAG: MFS transporter [Pseudomonadota bacterium]
MSAQAETPPALGPLLAAHWRRVLALLFLGFSAGLPILLIFSSLSLWLREAGVSRSAVTFFSWAALGYSFKFVWAPLVDKLPIPLLSAWLGRRRAWLLLAQLAVIAALFGMASQDPASAGLATLAVAAVALGFSSATQDIVIDAYRIEVGDSDVQALLSATYVAGYRIGMLVAGAGALYLAAGFGSTMDHYNYEAWANTYRIMALCMGIGIVTTFCLGEPELPDTGSTYDYGVSDYVRFVALFVALVTAFIVTFIVLGNPLDSLKAAWHSGDKATDAVKSFALGTARMALCLLCALGAGRLLVRLGAVPYSMLYDTYIAPTEDFIRRYGRLALWVLVLIGTYRIADIVMGAVSNVFYADMGYDKQTIASVTKVFGLLMTIAGGLIGGVACLRWGVLRLLFAGALLTAATNIAFMWLASGEPSIVKLAIVIGADNFSAGLASAAFIAWLSALTSIQFTATQYAVYSSLMTLFPKLLGGYAGGAVDTVGYSGFFLGTALLGVPVLLLILWLGRKKLV